MKRLIKILTFVLLSLSFSGVQAQQYYPVKVNPSVNMGGGNVGSVFLDDYEKPSSFQVQVQLKDVSVPLYTIRLKIKISGDNFTLESSQGIELTLAGGETYMLTSSDLSSLLSFNNLQGSIPGGGQERTLPEGAYHISFEAFDVRNPDVPVSNAATDFTRIIIEQNDPPMLNLPENGSILDLSQTGQNIMFTWTPRNFYSPPGSPVKYKLRLVKVVPVDRNPYEAINTGAYLINNQPFTDIQYPAFIYDRSQLQLEEGAVYAWQVQAYEEKFIDGRLVEATNRFKNEGLSEVYTFSVKENCTPLTVLDPEPDTSGQEPVIRLAWEGDGTHSIYEVAYRPAGSVLPWTVQTLPEKEYELGTLQLERGRQYEYTVRARCRNWQQPVFGGTFRLPVSECEAPKPILIDENNGNGIALNWDAVQGASSYKVTYQHETKGEDSTNLFSTEFTLQDINEGAYTIKVDAICGDLTGEGEEMVVDHDDNHYVGDCPLPEPFNLRVSSAGNPELDYNVKAAWSFLQVHESYELNFHHRDSASNVWTYNTTEPEIENIPVHNDQLYQYEVVFTCKGGETVTAPPGWFRLDATDNEDPVTEPRTADCFPPSYQVAEAKSTTTGRFEWAKVKEADEYQLLYAPKESNDFELFTTTSRSAKIRQLTEEGKYHYKIRCRCGSGYSIYTDLGLLDLGIDNSGTCDSLPYFTVNNTTKTEVQLAWPKEEDPRNGYTVYYKESSQPWENQYSQDLSDMDALNEEHLSGDTVKYTIINLSEGTTYDFKIKGKCGSKEAVMNDPVTATTLPLTEDNGDCASPQACDRSITEPIESLSEGDTVQIVDYTLIIGSVSSSGDNLWSGSGIAEAPFIGYSENIQLEAAFTDLKVNTEGCVLDGDISVDSLSANVLDEETREQIKKIVDDVDRYTDIGKGITSGVSEGLEGAESAGQDGLDHFQGGGSTGSVKTGALSPGIEVEEGLTENEISVSGGTVEINGTTYNEDLPVLIKDGEGTVYNVDADGTVSTVGHYDEELAGLQESKVDLSTDSVAFKKNKDQVYGFDAFRKEYAQKPAMQPHYLNLGGKYFSAKAIVPSATDKVDFEIFGADYDKVTFVNREGFVFEKGGNTLTLAGGPAGDAQEVLAVHIDGEDTTIIGALLLASYEPKTKKVVLIPVQMEDGLSQDISAIEARVNRVYGQAGITYEVEVDESFKTNEDWCDEPNCLFESTGSGALNNDYTGHEKAVRSRYIEFKGEENLDPEAAYVFLTRAPHTGTEEELQGKMNFGKQFGFLYSIDAHTAEEEMGRILAHELGHGNYNLYHIFEDMYLGDGEKYHSDNIMSYDSGEESLALNKLQWDVVHEPGVTWGVFARDEDQEGLIVNSPASTFSDFKNESDDPELDGTFTFLSLSGKYITLPSDVASVKISTLDRAVLIHTEKPSNQVVPVGALKSFLLSDGTKYFFHIKGNTFKGYTSSTSNFNYYEDTLTNRLKPSSGICLFVGEKDNKFRTIVSRFPSPLLTPDYTNYNGPLYNGKIILEQEAVSNDLDKSYETFLEDAHDPAYPFTFDNNPIFDLQNDNLPFSFLDGGDVTIKGFLQEAITPESSVKDYLYYFSVVNLKEHDVNSFSSCYELEESIDLQNVFYQLKMPVYEKMEWGNRLSTSINDIQRLTLDELARKAVNDISIEAELEAAIAEGQSSSEIYDILTDNYKKCALGALDFDIRRGVFEKLVSDEDHWTIDGNHILVDLIETTPLYDEIDLLNAFRSDNYNWINEIIENASDFEPDQSAIEKSLLLSSILNPLIDRYYDELNIAETVEEIDLEVTDNSSNPVKFRFHAGEEPFYIGGENEESYTLYNSYQVIYNTYHQTDDFSITDAGKVRLKQTYFLKDVQTYIENPENPVDRTILSEFDATFDPFEPVTLIVVKNYPGIRLDKETQLILPAYTAFLIKELIRENQWDQTERVALNTLEIGAAFFSGGLSSIGTFTLRAAATVAAMDLYVQEELQSLNSGEYTEKEVFINRWNAFKATVDIADAGVGGVALYRNLPSLMDKTVRVKAWKQLNGTLKQASALPGNLRIAWKRIATGNIDFSAYPNITQVSEPSFLTKLDEDLWSHTNLSRLNDDLADATLRAEMGSNPGLVDAWKKMNQLGADEALRRNPGALEVLDLKAKGQLNDIPDPSGYLPPGYISEHLARFDEGIGRVSTRANFEEFGTLGGNNSFVLPAGELRQILNETGGNVREIEKRLGMHEGDLGDNPVFGIFERESVGDIKMPSGREGGADADLWIPGGKTSGGTSEAIVDLLGNTSFNLIN